MSSIERIEVTGNDGFRALAELSPDVIALLDLDGRVRYVNPAVVGVLGIAPAQLIGEPLVTFVHPDDRARAGTNFGGGRKPGDEFGATLRFRHRDGSWRQLETRARRCTNCGDSPCIMLRTRDITRFVETERTLRAALAEASRLYDEAGCGYHSLADDGVIIRINDTELNWLGYTREEVVGRKNFRELLTPVSQLLFDRSFPNFKQRGWVQNLEFELIRKDGSLLPVLISAVVVKDAEDRYVGSRSTMYDITDRKRTELSLSRANRALRVLSAVNSTLVHAEAEESLLSAVCRAIVERGGYRLAWVGLAQHDMASSVLPVAQAGFQDGYLEEARITWADDERGQGPTGMAIRTGRPQVNRNFLTNPATAPWRETALRHGFQSSIALPLKSGSVTVGALTIYAAEPDAFDLKEISLLSELANDVSFGIETLRARREHQSTQAAVERLAFFDPLTGLPNRTRLLDTIGRAITDPSPDHPQLALLTINIDGFHDIQTGIGVRQADELLVQVSERLKTVLPDGATIARIGGESFAVLLGEANRYATQHCAAEIHKALEAPFLQAGIPLNIGVHIGAALSPDHGEDPEVLLVRSGSAARQARRNRRDYQLYTGTTASESPQRLALIGDLRQAIEADQLVLHYQPKIDVASGCVAGAEALLRWQHPTRGLLLPGEFIPIAEQTGLIRPLTYSLMNAALRQVAQWREQGFEMPVGVNVSARNFADSDFVERTLALLRTWGVPPELLQLELTESTLMDEPSKRHDQLERIKAEGISVAIDDFGTGYSSLSYVATLPIDTLKIDRAFVSAMLAAPRMHSIVAGTISLAKALALNTVAEGVETREQAQGLIDAGCRQLQGFYFSPGIPADDFRHWAGAFSMARYGLAAPPATEPPPDQRTDAPADPRGRSGTNGG